METPHGTRALVLHESRIAYFESEPPENTRAWSRAMLLRAIPPERITRVNWDHIALSDPRFRIWSVPRTLEMADPLRFGKDEMGPLLTETRNFDDLLESLDRATSERQQSAGASASSLTSEDAIGSGVSVVPTLTNARTPLGGAYKRSK